MHDKVFAYIVQSQHNETLECHAFLCPKKKTVSQECFSARHISYFLPFFVFKKKNKKKLCLQKGERENRKGGDGGIPLQHSLHLWWLNSEPLPPLPSPRQFSSGQKRSRNLRSRKQVPFPLDGAL